MIKEGQIFSFENTVKFWTKHEKMSDGTTGKIVSLTNKTSALLGMEVSKRKMNKK